MSSGAIVLVRFVVSNLLEHDEEDWDWTARAVIEEEGILSLADDTSGEIVSIEKWHSPFDAPIGDALLEGPTQE